MNMSTDTGIYEILNTANGKRYIGSALNFARRWIEHRRQLRRGVHPNHKLQRAWNKYGESSFKFLPILTCQPSQLLFYEQQLLDKAQPEYNIAKVAGSQLGYIHTVATREKMSASHAGKPRGPLSAATRAKLSAAHTGMKYPSPTPEHRARISVALKGKKRPAAIGAAISAATRGKKRRPLSIEHKAKIAASNRKPKTLAHRANISAAQLGRPHPVKRMKQKCAILEVLK